MRLRPPLFEVKKEVPSNVKCLFPNLRLILDCTDFRIASPMLHRFKRIFWSDYRHMHSFQVLFGCTPNGVITFVSKAYPGSSKD